MTDDATEMRGETGLMIRRTYAVPIETLFRALTDPAAITQWFGPGSAKVHHAESDLRVGGRWAIEMMGENAEEHSVSGEYVAVDPPHTVSFTWAWRTMPEHVSRVTYRLAPAPDGGTTLTLTHAELSSSEARDRHAFGWNGSLDKLGPWLGT